MPKGERQEVSVLTATIPPGGKTPFHTHRFPGTVYIFRRHLHSRTIERAKGLPSVETLDVIASKLDIPIGDFFPVCRMTGTVLHPSAWPCSASMSSGGYFRIAILIAVRQLTQ